METVFNTFNFDIKESRRKGHDFKDYICPDSMSFKSDYFTMGERFGRVLFLREYASYIKEYFKRIDNIEAIIRFTTLILRTYLLI